MARASDDSMWWLVPFLIVVAAIGRARATRAAPIGRWVWPMPRLPDGRPPVVSDGYHMRPGGMHEGADVMYVRRTPLAGPLKFPLADHGSKMFEVPAGTVVMAAAAGKVWSTVRTARGWGVVIDHGKAGGGRSTFYQHMESIAVPEHRAGKRADGGAPLAVIAGDVIGVVGYSSIDGQQLRHLHFELRDGRTPIDPQPEIDAWEIMS